MKTLLLMRHAKSSWKDVTLSDHERPLNKRGKRDAPMMGKLLVEMELVPQYIISSDAKRARLTAEAVIEASGFDGEIRFTRDLYHAGPEEYIENLSALPDEIERTMLIGHNPGMESLLQILSNEIESLPTAAIAYLELSIDSWREFDEDNEGTLVELWRPRVLWANR